MSVELIQTLSFISYIAAAVLLMIAISLFFILDVPKLFGDVTGTTARKAIENIRRQNEKSEDKAYKSAYAHAARERIEKITDRISTSENFKRRITGLESNSTTDGFLTAELAPSDKEFSVISNPKTTVLNTEQNETTVLASEFNTSETTFITQDQNTNDFSVDFDISFTSSSEIIE